MTNPRNSGPEAATSTLSCALIGEGALLHQAAVMLRERGVDIVAVVTDDPLLATRLSGLGMRVHPRGDDHGFSALEAHPFDYLFSIVNLTLLPEALLRLPRVGAVNFHDGPLPDYAGLHTPSWALLAGEEDYGVTWHEMTAGADRGRILVQRRFSIPEHETAFSLNARCFQAGIESFGELVTRILGNTLEPAAQDFSRRTLFTRYQRPAGGGLLAFGQPTHAVVSFVAAHDFGAGFPNPFGLPRILLGNRVFHVTRALAAGGSRASSRPGTILELVGPGAGPDGGSAGLRVATADGAVLLSGLEDDQARPVSLQALRDAGAREGGVLPDGPRDLLTEAVARGLRQERAWRRALTSGDSPLTLPSWTRIAGSPAPAQRDDPHDDPRDDPHDAPRNRQVAEIELLDLAALVAPSDTRLDAAPDAGHTPEPLEAMAAVVAFLARLQGSERAIFGLDTGHPAPEHEPLERFVYSRVPVRLDEAPGAPARASLEAAARTLASHRAQGVLLRDTFLRYPELREHPRDDRGPRLPVILHPAADAAPPGLPAGTEMEIRLAPDGRRLLVRYDASRFDAAAMTQLARQARAFVTAAAGLPDGSAEPLASLPLLDPEQEAQALAVGLGPVRALPPGATVHGLIGEQAARTPDAPAVTARGETLTYRELDDASARLAARLVAAGVTPGSHVGIFLPRSTDLVVAVLGVLKAGAAYVPLDPAYPEDRVQYMMEDAGLAALVSDPTAGLALPPTASPVVSVREAAAAGDSAPLPVVDSEALAYVLYTSGSTGRPKGVMVEHRNVVSFFLAMNERLEEADGAAGAGADAADTADAADATVTAGQRRWLAVTSLNFDISVLELFWTLTRGFHVVVHAEGRGGSGAAGAAGAARGAPTESGGRSMEFGLFYFSSDEEEGLSNRYHLLLEGAKFADREGFNAVWTPERHFHAFGGLFPNPSVTSAALATITENVELRAGSCVSPLHSPVRIAEEWSVVDNLSRGRVGISFAAGWQPDDFVIRPEAFADRKAQMFRDIDTVKALWRGESIRLPNGEGREVDVSIRPRPFSRDLPVWVTAAGNPETFRQAGASGANLLTHLLGQSLEELAEKIAIYRQARAEAGHAGRGTVSLMLHTWVGESDAQAREVVRAPMKAYLKSAVGLVKAAAWSFPTFRKTTTMEDGSFGIDHLSDEDMDALLDFSFERYYETAGLFGSVESCIEFAERIAAVDVDDVPCLIDFGIPAETVLESLPRLARVMRAFRPREAASVAELLETHQITHMQCTPSMATLLLADPHTRQGLARLDMLLVGGEAFPAPVARELAELVGTGWDGSAGGAAGRGHGRVVNMYGPTEATVWASTHEVDGSDAAVPIGRPLANTHLVILDPQGAVLPVGAMGELHIGGEPVARGYLHRPELTGERFVPRVLSGSAEAAPTRFYRTGDLARFRADGTLEFHGRLDHQVKVRGYRVELGEIEAVLAQHPAVKGAAVIVREDTPGDRRIVAYVVGPAPEGAGASIRDALRDHAAELLPDYMVPATFVVLDRFPETPNRKIDRGALPRPTRGSGAPAPAPVSTPASTPSAPVAPAAAPAAAPVPGAARGPELVRVEGVIREAWQTLLDRDDVGRDDNFFDLGGHSLLVIQLQGQLVAALGQPLSLVDLFRYPTVASLAARVVSAAPTAAASVGDAAGSTDPDHPDAGAGPEGEMATSSARGSDRREAMARRGAARRGRG